jgi:hypothetical protein
MEGKFFKEIKDMDSVKMKIVRDYVNTPHNPHEIQDRCTKLVI